RRKLVVQLAEFNVVMGPYRYLPYSTGLLRAYAEGDQTIKSHCQFLPFLYEMDTTKNIWLKLQQAPDVAAFSVSMWNEQLSLSIARMMKQAYGDKVCIVFGGCHIPHRPLAYMEQHPFIDVCVASEGEEAFKQILLRAIGNDGFADIPGVSYRLSGQIVETKDSAANQKDLDIYPSPYLLGLFDSLIDQQ